MKTRRYVAVERIPRTFLGKLRFLLFGTTITELKEVVENPEYEEAQFEGG